MTTKIICRRGKAEEYSTASEDELRSQEARKSAAADVFLFLSSLSSLAAPIREERVLYRPLRLLFLLLLFADEEKTFSTRISF